jgi:hypothetical protein
MTDNGPDGIRPGSHRGPRSARRGRVWWIAGIAALAAVLVAAVVIIGTHVGRSTAAHPTAAMADATTTAAPAAAPGPVAVGAPAAAPDPASASLVPQFAQFEPTLHAKAGIVISPVGGGHEPITLGDWQSGPAWSTIKIPLAIAALRKEDPPTTVTDPMKAAITESDNAAAESIWATLGEPIDAAHAVEGVLGPTGDPTVVQSQRVRPPFTAFGQTEWSLSHQVQFISSAACDPADAPILTLMGQIEPGQSWGIGTIPGTQFKGGWGPSPTGNYLVRQIGILTTPNGMIAVALAAEPASGQFGDGTADLTEMAKWLTDHLAALPTGQCGS